MHRPTIDLDLGRGTSSRVLPAFIAALLLLGALLGQAVRPSSVLAADLYDNPLLAAVPGDGVVESCADPSTFYADDGYWYTYCTTDPLNGEDRNANGGFNFHKLPTLRSADLVTWTYVNDAFTSVPAWGEPTAGMWAPEIKQIGETYYLFYGITDVKDEVSGEPGCSSDNAIGYATSASPTGPWVDSGGPLVEPRRGGGGCNFFWTYDPEVLADESGNLHIYFGSYYGGIFVRDLLIADGGVLTAPAATSTQITIANRYEGAEVAYRDGHYYLFVSATDCCRGPLTGYSVFVGRSSSPTGPFVDQVGSSLLESRVGGTPVLSMNGNRWVGTGHNSVLIDFDGQWWTTYHAVDREDPYFAGAPGFTKRPLLIDPVDWVDGWPQVRGGLWASDEPMPAPAAQPGDTTAYSAVLAAWDEPRTAIKGLSDEFNGNDLHNRWRWVRGESAEWSVGGGVFTFDTQAADLYEGSNSASVLTQPMPGGDYIVETKVRLSVPADGCCFNYRQAGLVVYAGDDSYVKLAHVSIWETRQTEFAKEVPPAQALRPYGNTVVGPPGEWTWLRIAKQVIDGEEHYRAYTSDDGVNWVRGGVWTHDLGSNARIGLVSMGGDGFTAEFDYVRVYRP
ncbi:MAG: family 43 glycosylhydrolase [Chloroflexota bacterium]|nr:family 43 glycosylhydrolase [Chloroflexota bacterium]